MANAGNVQTAINYLEKQNSAYLEAEKSAAQYAAGSQEHIGTLGNAYISSLLTLKDALSRYGKEANASTRQAVLDALDAVKSSKESYGAAGGDLGDSTIQGFREGVGTIDVPMDSVLTKIESQMGDFETSGLNLVMNLSDGMRSGETTVQEAMNQVVAYIKNGGDIDSLASSLNTTGADVMDGLANGIDGGKDAVIAKMAEAAGMSIDEFKAIFGIQSPSTVMAEVGDNVMLGLSEGITRTGASVMVEAGNVGLNIARGIAAGISLGAPTINQAAASAVSGAIQAAKDAGVIRSPSRKMKKEVGLQLSIGAAKGILQGIPNIKTAMSKTISTGISYAEKAAGMAKHVGEIIPTKMAAGMAENEKAATEQFDKMLSVLDHQRAMDLISEAEYYERLTKLRDDYLSDGTKEYAQQTEKIYSYYKGLAEDQEKLMQEQKEAVKDLFSDLADYAADKLDDVQGEIDSFAEKLRGIGGLYDEIDLGGGRTYKRLRNFDEDTAAMTSYGEQLTALREKLSQTDMDADTIKMFFAELRDLDIAEGVDLTRMFNQMSEADFAAYLAGYKQKYDVSQQVAGMLHGDEYDDAVQDINEHTSEEIIKFMKEELEAAGAEIPDGFFDVGRQSAENFSGSFLTVFQNMLNEVKSQIDAASASFAPHLAYAGGAPGNYASTVYGDTNYNIYGGNSDDLTAQIQAMETRKRMLGIGG